MPFKPVDFEWLLANHNNQPRSADDLADTAILPPCPAGQVQMEQIPVLAGAGLFFFKARFDDAAVLRASDGRSGSNLGLILTQTGNYHIETEDAGRPCPADQGAVILHSPEDRPVNFLFPADGQIDAMALMLGREALAEMLGPDRPPKLLNDWLENRSGLAPFANRMASTPAFASATRQLASNPYQGSSRRMFFEAKAMEGFAELLHCLSGGEAESRALALSAWERSRLFEARDLLMAHIADPPALAELARQVGLPVKRLDRLFREVFGTTPFGWVRDYRLTLAKQLLTEENLPIKQVAHRLGYSNVHNFTHAFTARFGMPPGAMRKGKKA